MAFIKGYQSYLEIVIPGLSAISNPTFTSHIRDNANATLLAILTTENGRITIRSGDIMRFTLPASITSSMQGEFILDVVRTDVSPAQHQGFMIKGNVTVPVTRIQ